MVRRRQANLDPSLPGRPRSYKVDGRVWDGREVTSAEHPYTPIYCPVRGNSNLVPMVVFQLDDMLYKSSDGDIPVHLVGFCPRCGQDWQIRGDVHVIKVDYLDRPVPIDVMGEQRAQTVNVSVEGVRACPGVDSGGKGICGFRFRLQDNVLIAER